MLCVYPPHKPKVQIKHMLEHCASFQPVGVQLFQDFLASEHSDENIRFWVACERYKTVKSGKQMVEMANRIYEDFVAVQSRTEVSPTLHSHHISNIKICPKLCNLFSLDT